MTVRRNRALEQEKETDIDFGVHYQRLIVQMAIPRKNRTWMEERGRVLSRLWLVCAAVLVDADDDAVVLMLSTTAPLVYYVFANMPLLVFKVFMSRSLESSFVKEYPSISLCKSFRVSYHARWRDGKTKIQENFPSSCYSSSKKSSCS